MDSKQREAVFAFFLCILFAAIMVFLNLFGLKAQPLFSFLALFSAALLGYLISLKGGDVGLKPLHAAMLLLLALFAASLKSELGVFILPTVAIPVSVVLLLSLLGPLRASLFAREKK
ncbi:MAG: hypothetical protein WC350_03025 [Candidatus Micrarchaeia archaeon]|jgi:glucan phosphoethanolaminetransferase (alkaline phosphatase superfamily)